MISKLLQEPLAITEEFYNFLSQIDEKAIVIKEGEKPKDTILMQYRDNTAIIDIKGAIMSDSFLSWLFDIASPEAIAKDFDKAINDKTIDAIVFNIDSPGGQVTGINELSNMIYNARSVKPILAYIGGIGASAAYWIASAADQIIIDDTGRAGSIGVVIGYRKQDKSVIEIVSTASPKKRINVESEEGKAQLLAQADAIADVFISTVARNRNVSIDTVLNQFGQGGILVGKDAVNARLADKLGSLEGTLREYKTNNRYKEFSNMKIETVEQFKENFPALASELENSCKLAGKQEGLKESTDKIFAFMLEIFGKESFEKFKSIIETGITIEQFKAVKAVETPKVEDKKEDTTKEKMLENIIKAGAENPGSGYQNKEDAPKDFNSAVESTINKENITKAQAIKKCVAKYPDLHAKYLESLN